MTTAIAATQPAASQLLDHAALMERIRRLSANPRVWAGTAGYSHQGREIPYVVVGAPDAIDTLEYHRRAARRLFLPGERSETLATLRYDAPSKETPDKVPVLIVGASFGNEAAHTEAILEVAERLAGSGDAEVREILGRVIVIMVPLINPDGREAALEEWQGRPRSPALIGSVNAWGSMLNRDFFALTQPETRAVLQVYREWHPIAAYDPHEDMYILGVRWPQVCWTPPFAHPVHPELDPAVVRMINQMGNAIAASWRSAGFNLLHDPNGDHGFMNLFRLGGRFHLSMALHGVPALITESARTPGSQAWEDRTQQKVLATFAVLSLVARDPAPFLDAIRTARTIEGPPDAYVLPKDQRDNGALRELVSTLLLHEVWIYETDTPTPAYVIPMHQPDGRLVRSLLGTAGWNSVSLTPSLGIRADRVSALPEAERSARLSAPLARVRRIQPQFNGRRDHPPTDWVAIRNNVSGVRAVNRLWGYGIRTAWAAGPFDGSGHVELGTFVAELSPPSMMGLALDGAVPTVQALQGRVSGRHLRPLRSPRVAIYIGQGVDDRYLAVSGDTRWACRQMGFRHVELTEGDLHEEILARFDVLIIPGGDAAEIVTGRGASQPWQLEPWEQPGPRRGIGDGGSDAIRRFVDRGGSYIGLGCGGGTLAGTEFLGLADIHTETDSLGEGRVRITIHQPVHPVTAGVADGVRASSEDPLVIPAYYYSELAAGIRGGPIFRAGAGVSVLASYTGLDDATAEPSFTSPALLATAAATPAVLHAPYGRGNVTVFSISPDFRGVWWSTYVLLSNAIFAGVAG